MTLRVLIVEDEPVARDGLCALVEQDPGFSVVGMAATGPEAVMRIIEIQPDIVLLDVRIPEYDGMEVLRRVGTAASPVVIFVTAHDAYAVKAFDAAALDYVLKPVSERRLRAALERARTAVTRAQSFAAAPVDTLALPGPNGIQLVKVADILWIESADYYARVHTAGGTSLVRRSIQEIEQDLGERFMRIHRRFMVNRSAIVALRTSGGVFVELTGGRLLPVSRRRRREVQAALRAGSRD